MIKVTTSSPAHSRDFGDYIALLKPRVMSLVVFTAAVGLLVAPNPVDPVLSFAAILFVAIGAGASGALNMWWDADIDRIMVRTQNRPIPAGRLEEGDALTLGLWLSALSVLMLGLAANWLAAGLLAFTIFFYCVIYTIWLKRTTPQNIVIGGVAGALPPVIGWAVATGGIALEAVGMFALIFMWTPPHFWALALFMKGDYAAAGVPMLNVTHGRAQTRRHIFIYAVALVPVALALGVSGIGGPIYSLFAIILNSVFVALAWQIYRRSDADSDADHHRVERLLFRFSLFYLFLLFGALLVDAYLRPYEFLPFSWPVLI